MLNKTLATALLGTVLIAAPAYAQSPAPAPGQQPAAAAGGQWINQMKPGQWRASKLHDINVYNNNNEKIGEIDDILLDQSGKAEVVVIEVGGFLGMGKHTVALPYSQVKFMDQPRDSGRTTGNAPNTAGNAPTTGMAPADRPAGAGRPQDATGGRGADNRDARAEARDRGYPDHAVLNMTKDQLKAAPEFKWSANR
jgi:sporulation protein YlmC with PRC-barrel domain